MKSFDYVKNYKYLYRPQFIDLVKLLRNKSLTEYNGQAIDYNYNRLIDLYTTNYVGLDTTKDGNCLFHAVSLNLFGSRLYSFKIKLATVFISLEYEEFVKNFLLAYSYRYNFETLILNTVQYGVWGSEIHFLLFSLLLNRPIYIFNPRTSFISNPLLFSSAPVVLFLMDSHFVAAVRRNFTGQVSMPTSDQMRFYRNIYPQVLYYS